MTINTFNLFDEEKINLLLENLHDVLWVMDIKTQRFTYVSPSVYQLRGYTQEEAMAQTIEEVLTPASLERIGGLLDELMQKFYEGDRSSFIVGELEQTCKNCPPVWTEIVASFVTDNSGEIVEMLGVTRNITERKKALQALEESERRFRELADLLPQNVYELDLNGKVVFSNKAGHIAFQAPENESLIGRNALEFFIPEDRERMINSIRLTMAGDESPRSKEYTALKRDGTTFPVIIYGAPIKNNGQVVGSRGIIIDITERKQMEEALKKSEEKYRTLIKSMQEGLYVIQDGKFTFLNEGVVQIVGYEVHELLGTNFIDVIAPESKAVVAENYMKRVRGEESPSSYEANLLHKDGHSVPVILSVALSDYEGRPAVIGTAKNITERLKSEQLLRNRERRLNAILDGAFVGITMTSKEGLMLHANSRCLDMFGYSESEFYRMHFTDLTYQEDREISQYHFDALSKGLINKYHFEKRYMRKDGTVFWGDVSVTPIYNDDMKMDTVIAIIFDLTERKKIEEELRLAQEKLKMELQKESIRSQFETLKNQVNPHFLFNSLNVLSSLISLEPATAEKFTEQLAKVYRYVLENKDRDIVTLETEFDFLKSYTFLLEFRFRDKLKIHYNLDESKMNDRVPTLSLQLLIENAIKHNTLSKKQPLSIDITIDDWDYLTVVNNFQPREHNIESTGVGLKNIANRYSLLTDKPTFFGVVGDKYVAKIPLLS